MLWSLVVLGIVVPGLVVGLRLLVSNLVPVVGCTHFLLMTKDRHWECEVLAAFVGGAWPRAIVPRLRRMIFCACRLGARRPLTILLIIECLTEPLTEDLETGV